MAGAVLSTPTLCAADVNTTINHEPRILDVRLAEVLGFSRLYDIRKLIRRHMETLRTFGEVCAIWRKPSEKGGRPAQTYWLSKRQALFITAKSDTDQAAHVTVQMVEVFDEVTSGGFVAVSANRRRPRSARIFDGSQRGRGCIVLDKPVFFDIGRRPAPGELAVVAFSDGHIGVVSVPEQWPERYLGPSERAFIMVEMPGPHGRGVLSVRERVTLVGAVTTPSGAPKRLRA